MRNFALRDAQGSEIGVFTGRSPRQAALKAANRDYTDIKLRERGTQLDRLCRASVVGLGLILIRVLGPAAV